MEENETKLVVLGMAGTTIIGELSLKNASILKTPRILQTLQRGNETLLIILPLVGNPEELVINNVNFSYVPNMELANIYVEQTTGIKVVKQPIT